MSSKTSTQSNATNIAAIMEQIKSANGLSQLFDAIIAEWSTANEEYMARLIQTAEGMKKHIDDMEKMVALLSNAENAAQKSEPMASTVPLLKMATTKRALPSTSQVEPIPQSAKSTDNKTAATIDKEKKGQNANNQNAAPKFEQTASKAPPLPMVATKRAMPSTSQVEPIPQSKRVKSSDNTTPADKENNNQNPNEVKPAAKRYPRPFVLLSPMEIKSEQNENVLVVNSKTGGKMTVSVVTGVVRENVVVQPMRRSKRLSSQTQAKPPNQASAQPQTSAQGNSQKWSWTQNKLVSSTPNAIGSDNPKKGEKGVPINAKKMVPGKAQRSSARHVTQRRASKQ